MASTLAAETKRSAERRATLNSTKSRVCCEKNKLRYEEPLSPSSASSTAPRITLPYSRSHSSSEGNGGPQAQLLGIAGVDSGNKWRNEIFENLMPEFSPHEIGHRFLPVRRLGPAKRFGDNLPARPGLSRELVEQGLRRHRHFLHFAVAQHITRRPRIGLQSSPSIPSSRIRSRRLRCPESFAGRIRRESRLARWCRSRRRRALRASNSSTGSRAFAGARRRQARRFPRR